MANKGHKHGVKARPSLSIELYSLHSACLPHLLDVDPKRDELPQGLIERHADNLAFMRVLESANDLHLRPRPCEYNAPRARPEQQHLVANLVIGEPEAHVHPRTIFLFHHGRRGGLDGIATPPLPRVRRPTLPRQILLQHRNFPINHRHRRRNIMLHDRRRISHNTKLHTRRLPARAKRVLRGVVA